MQYEEQPSGRRKLVGEVRGRVRSALMGWTDPVTGDRLRISVKGEPGLVDSLEPLGFEPLDGEDDSAPPSAFERLEAQSKLPRDASGSRIPGASFFHARLVGGAKGAPKAAG